MRLIAAVLVLLIAAVPNFSNAENLKPRAEATLSKSQAKRQSVQSGEIKLEDAPKAKDSHGSGIDSASKYFTSLQKTIQALSTGSISKPEEADEDGIRYVSAAYLYCSINKGVCAYFLDSMLEADVINGRINKQNTCPHLRKFWKEYLSNDLENRHKYATKIGFLAETGEFNNKVRPKYIKCVDTVKEARESDKSDSEFFKARYADGAKAKAVSETLAYLKELKDQKIHLYNEVSNLR